MQNPYGPSLVTVQRRQISVKDKLQQLFPVILKMLQSLGAASSKRGFGLYLVGGFPRDLLLGKINYDLDLVTDANLKWIITFLRQQGIKVKYYPRFQTAQFKLGDFHFDLARARKEVYPAPGALPEVKPADIVTDLWRRDFSLNTLLVDLKPLKFGNLIDHFAALADLQQGQLKVLHRRSFQDDPTRIIRGMRLAKNLGFSFEPETDLLARRALEDLEFTALSPGRVIKDLRLLFQDPLTPELITLIKSYPFFKLLSPKGKFTLINWETAAQLEAYLESYREKNYNIKEWMLRLALFTEKIEQVELEGWGLSPRARSLFQGLSRYQDLRERLKRKLGLQELFVLLRGYTLEELLLILLKSPEPQIKDNLEYYLKEF